MSNTKPNTLRRNRFRTSSTNQKNKPFIQSSNNVINNNNLLMSNEVCDYQTRLYAQKNHERFLAMAKNALADGDRIAAEGFFQHADHYYRVASINVASNMHNGYMSQSFNNNPYPPFNLDNIFTSKEDVVEGEGESEEEDTPPNPSYFSM